MTCIGMLGGALAWVWAAAYVLGNLLPDGWMKEWYGFPTIMTALLGLVFAMLICGYLCYRLEDR